MTRPEPDESPSLWSEQWAIQASVEADAIEHRMRVALAAGPLDENRRATAEAIAELVASAREATQRRRRRRFSRRFRGPFDRWRGTSVERAYQSLHAARVFLVELLPAEDVNALAPSVVARAATILSRDDPRRLEIDRLLHMPPGPAKRAALRQAMEITYDASDQLHVRVRGFRNILISSAALIALLMIALVLIVRAHPAAMPLCFTPAVTAGAAQPGAATAGGAQPVNSTTVCPSGDRQAPSGGDVLIVSGLGLLGGALAGAFAIRNIRGSSTPYDIPIALAFLKVPSGSLTAVAGILLLGGGFVPGLSELDSQRQILAYALVFGYAQQLGTRFIDDRAQTILNSLPSKDPEAKQPEPPLQTLSPRPAPATPAPEAQPGGRGETSIDSSAAN
jgi:hypothetical protein